MRWSIEDILEATQGRLLGTDAGQAFDGVAIDSRSIQAAELFVAIVGDRHDGHRFIDQVVDLGVRGIVVAESSAAAGHADLWAVKGVACIVVADTQRALGGLAAFQRHQARIPVVAITGSNGKTSTRRMTALVMGQQFNTLATRGNLNNEIGLPLTLFRLAPDHQAAVLELGMNHPGEIDRLAAICRPTIGVITNVAAAHLEFLGSLEGVARAKGELVGHIDARGTLILNGDDPLVAGLAEGARCPVLFYGMDARADIRAEKIEAFHGGVDFDLVLPRERIRVHLKTPGQFMVYNALAAATAGHAAGLDPDRIRSGLEAFEAEKGRLQIETTAAGVHLIDDTYNANPQSMRAALDTLSALRGDKDVHVALGDMLELGAAAEEQHFGVGRYAARSGANRLYLFGDYARAVAAGAREGGMPAETIFIGSKAEIMRQLREQVKPDAWLLVKGSRGMAMEDIVAQVRLWKECETCN